MGARAQTVAVQDSNFLKFLKRNYPKTIVGNQLVLSEAALVKGYMRCTGQRIQDAEGLQYFTSLYSIDLSDNQLTKLPALLRSDSIRTITLKNNQLKNFPDFSPWAKLQNLDVVDNNLGNLNGLDKLRNLQSILAKGNRISSVPALDSLKNLAALDLSYNQLEAYPVLAASHKVVALHLNNNHIRLLPNKIIVPPSGNIWLYDNDLTFKELLKIKDETSIYYWTQNTIPVTRTVVKEMDTLVINSYTDLGVPDMRYRWYKNGVLLSDTTSDSFIKPSAAFKDSGKYQCLLTNGQLPDIELWTDSLEVNVVPCLNPNELVLTVSPITCKKSGTVQIKSPSTEITDYYLIGKTTGHVYHTSNGNFVGLSEPLYSLSIANKKGCKKQYPNEIKLEKEECQKALVTPNGDGETDTYFFARAGTVTIYDKNGAVIKSLSIPNEWDGSAKSGRVAPGLYLADVNNGEELINISVVY